jgi:hypothetical protein
MCHSKLKKSKKKGGYNIDDDNFNNRIKTQNITPDIDMDGYLIWKHINIGTIVITPDNGCIWKIVNYTVNTSVEGTQYYLFTLKCIIGCIVNAEIITTSYDFRVLVVFQQKEKSYNLGLITGYNHGEISFNVTTKDDENNIYNWSFNNTETVKSNIIGVIKSDDLINNLVMQDGLSELHRKYLAMKDMKAGKELINLRTIYNNNFQSSNISSYADIAKQRGLGINFGLPLFIGSLGAIGNQSAFGTQSTAFGTQSTAFGNPNATMDHGSNNSLDMANMILNIYLELLTNYSTYEHLQVNDIIIKLQNTKPPPKKILTDDHYKIAGFVDLKNKKQTDINLDMRKQDSLNEILLILFDTNNLQILKSKINYIENIIKKNLDTEKRELILLSSIKKIYKLQQMKYTTSEFFDGQAMLDKLLFLLQYFVLKSETPTPVLRFGPEGGGSLIYKNIGNKEILGKNRIIFKTVGSNKEYIKNIGMFIPVSEYKKQQKHK